MSADADLLYRFLLAFGPRSARAAGRELGVATRRVADALEELRVLGAVRPPCPATGLPAWSARDWPAVLAALRRRRARPVDPATQALLHLHVLADLPLAAVTRAAPDQIRRLDGREGTRRRIGELTAVEQHEHLAMNTEQAFSAEVTAAALPLERQISRKGVRSKTIGLPSADGDRLSPFESELETLGVGYRELPLVPMKLFVFDRRVALFPIDPKDFERGAVEVSAPDIVGALVTLFHASWARGSDPACGGVAPFTMSGRERALVNLLADGHTDVTAARILRLSPRSIAYTLRGLMDRLEVDNRFQLGVALGAVGVRPFCAAPIFSSTTPLP